MTLRSRLIRLAAEFQGQERLALLEILATKLKPYKTTEYWEEQMYHAGIMDRRAGKPPMYPDDYYYMKAYNAKRR